MLKNFKDTLKDFISDRAFDTGNTSLINNSKYKGLAKKSIDLHTLIKNHLPEEYKHLIDLYGETETMIGSITIEIIYEQGLKDGIELRNYILAS